MIIFKNKRKSNLDRHFDDLTRVGDGAHRERSLDQVRGHHLKDTLIPISNTHTKLNEFF